MTVYERRWAALERIMEKRRARAFVVSGQSNIRYLCCSHLYSSAPPSQLVFTGEGAPLALTSWLEKNRTEEQCTAGGVRVWGNLPGKRSDAKKSPLLVKKVLAELKAGTVLCDRKPDGVTGVNFRPDTTVENMRAVKSSEELARIRKACAIADYGAGELGKILSRCKTELEAACELDCAMRERGAQAMAFPTIIAAGTHSAYPHHDCQISPIRDTAVICDFGVYVEGYCSDVTRTHLVGKFDERLGEMYDAVRQSVLAGTKVVKPGVPLKSVDAACREALRERSLDGYFVHSTGHGIGLDVHEEPFVTARAAGRAKKGMVFTIEPGAYIKGLGGIRIENDVLVTSHGAEVLTRSPFTR
jgi:Xaa-Pro aminopeptidase